MLKNADPISNYLSRWNDDIFINWRKILACIDENKVLREVFWVYILLKVSRYFSYFIMLPMMSNKCVMSCVSPLWL